LTEGDLLERCRIVPIERELHDKTSVVGSAHNLHVIKIESIQLLVEVSWQRIGGWATHDFPNSIRSAGVASHPVINSQVVGSIVSSITSVRTLLASLRPTSSLRVLG
jgi:hypothetical protein